MGGHGGLNILPQKRWNVYNYENREKVKKDEEAAAKKEQIKREQSRKRDAEFRLDKLRAARGLPDKPSDIDSGAGSSDSGHINPFHGIDVISALSCGKESDIKKSGLMKKPRKEEIAPKTISPEEEKYRLGYGVAGKGVKLPWYLLKETDKDGSSASKGEKSGLKKPDSGIKSRKKTLEELREERLKREKHEQECERLLWSGRNDKSEKLSQEAKIPKMR